MGLSIQAARGEEFPPSLCGLPRLRPAFSTPLTAIPPFRSSLTAFGPSASWGAGSLTPYRRLRAGYHTVSVAGLDGYIYLQKSIPFDAGSVSTLAVILRTGGLELLQISDRCCPPTGRYSNLRVSNLAYYSNPLDVLLADGRVIYADVRFKETTSYKRIRPGTYEFFFAETNLTPPPFHADIETLDSALLGSTPPVNVVASDYVAVSSRTNYTIFLLSTGTTPDAVQALTTADR